MAIGPIQNLVVHCCRTGMSGVGPQVAVVCCPANSCSASSVSMPDIRLSSSVSVTTWRWSPRIVENDKRVAMHPAEQISGFRTPQNRGKPRRKSGDQLGYSAPSRSAHAEAGNLALNHFHSWVGRGQTRRGAVSGPESESDPARQVQVYDQVKPHTAAHPLTC